MTPSLRRSRLAALAALAALAPGALAACSDDEPRPASSGSTATDDASESSSATESTAEESPEDAEQEQSGTAVPVYYVGSTLLGPRLYREFHRVSGDPLEETAALVDGGTPDDPDYHTEWPGGVVSTVEATDGLLVVRLSGDAFTERPDGMTKRLAKLALQQMVYSLQGALQERVPVQFVRDGAPARLFGLDVTDPVKQGPELDVLGLVNVTSPAEGAAVEGGELQASGVASSFEATVPWQVRRGKEVVLDGTAQAEGWWDRLYPWQATLDLTSLEPGEYTFVAMTDDPSGGTEGTGPSEDTKRFTVQ